MFSVDCKIIPWKSLPTTAKTEFPHPSGMGSDFFHYDGEWYCIDYLDDSFDIHDYQNHTKKGTIINCNHAGNSIIVIEEYTCCYIPNIAKLLTIH